MTVGQETNGGESKEMKKPLLVSRPTSNNRGAPGYVFSVLTVTCGVAIGQETNGGESKEMKKPLLVSRPTSKSQVAPAIVSSTAL
jgi:hypothetical protein